jgi:hypothetical protein
MADQVEPGTTQVAPTVQSAAANQPAVATAGQAAELLPQHVPETFHGRTVSWVAVGIIMAGFVCGGFALVFGPTWWAFWTGLGVAGAGCLLGLATNIFDDWY